MTVNEIIASPQSAASLIANQKAEIESLEYRIRDLERKISDISWDNTNLRDTIDTKRGYDGY